MSPRSRRALRWVGEYGMLLLLVACGVNSPGQSESRIPLGDQRDRPTISGTVTYMGSPVKSADVRVMSFLEKKCFDRIASRIPLRNNAPIREPAELNAKERQWIDECTYLSSDATTDDQGRFVITVPQKRWNLVTLHWQDRNQAVEFSICKVGHWALFTYRIPDSDGLFHVDAHPPPLFLKQREHKDLQLNLTKPPGKEGRCRTTP